MTAPLKDINRFVEQTKATLDTVQTAIDELVTIVRERDDRIDESLRDVQRCMVDVTNKQQSLEDKLVVLQDQVVEGFRRLGARVTSVERKKP